MRNGDNLDTQAVKERVQMGEVTLSRDLDLFTVTMIGVGGMIGAGIFVLTGIAAGVAGPALILAFLLNGLVTSLTAMSYAELGSAFPGAGGGYLWVKAALGGAQGFLSGWMSWFAQTIAGSLYALAFGRFAAELIFLAGVPTLGLELETLSKVFMVLIIIAFTTINYLGASETATIGNILTVTKVIILALLVVFGLLAMSRSEVWVERYTTGFLPNGVVSIFLAMGLTFIAFEGYEIIAQSGEEVVNPRRNIPRAIFYSIGIVVVVYILVGFVAIGATTPPPGQSAHEYLGDQGEVAIIEVASQVFPWGIGAVVLLLSGLASTTSALNATTYSSSRVSFAMGRDNNLPPIFARIHPKRHTPYWAVIFSGSLMVLMAVLLPIEDVAAGASIMFLLMFLQVNLAAMLLRRQMPELDRGFKIPFFPAIPVIAIITNGFLAIQLFQFSAIAWYFAIGWIVVGLLAYYIYFSRVEEMEKPKEILLEEVLVSRDYSVLVPVANPEQAHILGTIGAILASAYQGEVLALNVVQVPPQLTLGEGRLFLKEGRACLEEAIKNAKTYDVPVHTIIRLGRNVASAVRQTVLENASDLMVLGWPGYTNTSGKLFGSVIDPIVDNPPTDVVVVRYRQRRPIRKILVPVRAEINSRRAVKLAVNMARAGDEGPAQVTLLHILPPNARNGDLIRAQHAIDVILEDIEYKKMERRLVEGADVVDTIIEESEGFDLIVVPATDEPLFKNLLVGPRSERIARRAKVTVMMVKRRSGPLHSFVRQALLEPTKPKPLDEG
jgi:amino acid transporter/nucleotide-binding universal stress UspA family protein